MTIKLLVYGGLLGGAFYLERQFGSFSRMPYPDLVFYGSLGAAYLALLYLEVRAGVRRGGTQSRLQWTGFGFTTGAGFLWAVALSTYRGTLPMLEGPFEFVAFLLGYIVFGAMWGVLGAVLTLLMLKFVFRRNVS